MLQDEFGLRHGLGYKRDLGAAPVLTQKASLTARRAAPATRGATYAERLKLTDVLGYVAKAGYARDVWRCCGLCRETWRWVPPSMSPADAARMRRDSALWQAIIDLPHRFRHTRLMMASMRGDSVRIRELCEWHANVNSVLPTSAGFIGLYMACLRERTRAFTELGKHGAEVSRQATSHLGPLAFAVASGSVKCVRLLLAAGAGRGAVRT